MPPLISGRVSIKKKTLNKRKRFPLARKSVSTSWIEWFCWNPIFCLVETVFWSDFWLMETIIAIREKNFSKKELILVSWQPIFLLVETIFFLYILETPGNFFPFIGKLFFKKILIFILQKWSLELIMASTSRKNCK